MLRKTVKKTRQWFGVNVLGRSPVHYWNQMEIQRRIKKLERAKSDLKNEMDEKKQAYDEKIDESRTADESRLQEIESEASLLLKQYKAAESQWAEVLNGLRFLQQAALGNQIGNKLPDAMPTGMNQAHIQSAAQGIKTDLEEREDKRIQMTNANEQMEQVWDTGASTGTMTDERVKNAIEAARSGKDVPTLDELADENFSPAETEREQSDPVAGETPDQF